jgi:hypothetical protein
MARTFVIHGSTYLPLRNSLFIELLEEERVVSVVARQQCRLHPQLHREVELHTLANFMSASTVTAARHWGKEVGDWKRCGGWI